MTLPTRDRILVWFRPIPPGRSPDPYTTFMVETVRRPIRYMPQLDSLRALAAVAVFAQHFLGTGNVFVSTVPLGDLGVRLFFVLSGFLITSILLDSRDSIDRGTISRGGVIRHFYARRFLRLIPVYFLFLGLVFLFIPDVRAHAAWFYTYLQNIHFALENRFTVADHVWTLAVEEQFYLMWPLLVLFLPRRMLTPTIVGVVALGIVARLAFLAIGMTHFQASMLTPAHFDTLGMGALLALAGGYREGSSEVRSRLLLAGLFVGVALLAVVLVTKVRGMSSSIEFVLGEAGAGLLFVWVVGHASRGFGGALGSVLDNGALIYLGKISYGMYVYHWFVPAVAESSFPAVGLPVPGPGWVRLVIFGAIAIGVASASWHLMERPVLRLKELFSYHQGSTGPAGMPTSASVAGVPLATPEADGTGS